jgi:protein SCO1/2
MREQVDRRRCIAFLLACLATPLGRPSLAHTTAPALISGFELPVPKALQPFALRDHRGRVFDNASFANRWTFLLFGYTHCPDTCPTTLLEIREVRRTLAARHHDIPTAAVFATVDPTRDTLERLAEYAASFGDGLTAVGGTPEAIKAFAGQFRVRYAPRSGAAGARGYDVDHSASVALLGPDGKLYAVFTLPLRPSRVAEDVARMYAMHPKARCDAAAASVRNRSCSTRST